MMALGIYEPQIRRWDKKVQIREPGKREREERRGREGKRETAVGRMREVEGRDEGRTGEGTWWGGRAGGGGVDGRRGKGE